MAFVITLTLCWPSLINSICTSWKVTLFSFQEAFEVVKLSEASVTFWSVTVAKAICRLIFFACQRLRKNCFFVFYFCLKAFILLTDCIFATVGRTTGVFGFAGLLLKIDTRLYKVIKDIFKSTNLAFANCKPFDVIELSFFLSFLASFI